MTNFLIALISTFIYTLRIMKYPLLAAIIVAIVGLVYFEIEEYFHKIKERS